MMARNQVETRLAVAREMIEAGLPDSIISRRLQTKFNVSRATAYRDAHAASDEINADPDGPAEREHADTAGMIAALLYDAQLCQEAGDYDGTAKLIRSADTLRRWSGMVARL